MEFVELIKVRRIAHKTGIDKLGNHLLSKSADVHGTATGEVLQPPLHLLRTIQIRAAQRYQLLVLAHIRATNGAAKWVAR
jgi:hypothetical protein